MRATERTPLKTPLRVLKYDPLQMHNDVENESAYNSGSTTVHIVPVPRKTFWSNRTFQFATVASVIVSACLIVASFQGPEPATELPVTPSHSKTGDKPLPHRPSYPHKVLPIVPIEGAAWSAIAQPLSLLDPETLGFLAIDRPPISMPGLIFGELLEKNVALPTNSWCENLFLGASNTESTNRVYQLPYVIDTEVHGNMSTQGVETHPCHVQANEKMVEVRIGILEFALNVM